MNEVIAALWQEQTPYAWGAVLALAAVLHIVAGVRLWWLNRRARPLGYEKQAMQETTLIARTMIHLRGDKGAGSARQFPEG